MAQSHFTFLLTRKGFGIGRFEVMTTKAIGQTALVVVGTVFLLEVLAQNVPAADIRGLASNLNFRG